MLWKPIINNRLSQLADFITIFVSFYISYFFWVLIDLNLEKVVGKVSLFNPLLTSIILIVSLLSIYFFKINGAYSYQRFTSIKQEFLIVLKVSVLSMVCFMLLLFLLRSEQISRTYIILAGFIMFILLNLEKALVFKIAKIIRNKGYDKKHILIVGTNDIAVKFIRTIRDTPNWGLEIAGLLTLKSNEVEDDFEGCKILEVADNIEAILRLNKIDDVIIAISSNEFDKIRQVFDTCEREGIQIRIISDFLGKVAKKMRADVVFDLPMISIEMTHESELKLFVKRTIDIVGALIGLIAFSPFMIAAIIGIYLSDGRPIFYNWNVIGKNKKPFKSWKFRTMIKNADKLKKQLLEKNEMDGPVFKMKYDPRIISFGRWLRKWSIDETPQLFSVLKGDMSLVGPRPVFPYELNQYESWHRRKLSVKPGITCLWQINGRNEITRFDDWIKMDLEYIDNWSLILDFKILLKTIPTVILGKGAR